MLFVGGIPQPTSAMIFSKKKLFIGEAKCRLFKKSYYGRSRSRTPANSKDGSICNNSYGSRPYIIELSQGVPS